MKRVLKWLAVVVLVLAVAVGALFYSAFGHAKAIEDGGEPAPGVKTVKDGFVSAFVVDVGGGKVALIDAGNDTAGQAILTELKRRALDETAVVAVFLTHGHGDHTAACKRMTGATVYAMANEISEIGDACRVSHPLRDGEVVQVGNQQVEAFATPGHTPGSAVYLAKGVLFFGDSAGGGKDGSVLPAVRFFTNNPDLNVASLKTLATRLETRAGEIKMLAFAHSGPLVGFAPLHAFAANH